MSFAGVNYLAIVAAAVAAWLAGAAWYMSLGKVWMAALGTTREQMAAASKGPGAYLPFLYVFIGELVMAWTLAGILWHLGTVTLRAGVISALFCWVGFVLTTIVPNYSFARRDWRLIPIDSGHWLLVMVIMGAIIGAMGVKA
jgi:hypothetical protein